MNSQSVLSKVDIRPDDIFLVSYPRSGNTWVGLLLSNYTSDRYSDADKLISVVAEIYHATPERMANMPSPRLIKFHGPYESSLPRVIYLVRDARDVATSYYFFLKKNGLEISFQEYLQRFNRGTVDQSFGSWNDRVSWLSGVECSFEYILVP